MFGTDAAPFIFVKAIGWTRFMQLDHEGFHVVKLEVSLSFGFGADLCKDGGLIKVDLTIRTVFFVSCDAR